MDRVKNGWFTDISELWPGQGMSLKVEEILYQEKSKYQDIVVFKSKTYGNVLVLDGVIQCTERDEFAYQEMIAHLPLNSHPCPKRVLIIGGGDGGVVREVVKHPYVESVDLCEIDEVLLHMKNPEKVKFVLYCTLYGMVSARSDTVKVVEVSKKYLPHMACGFSSPKLSIHFGDGFKYMGCHQGQYDVIVTDSSDPIGPASPLFQQSYYELMKSALKPGGIICTQGECIWLHLDLIKSLNNFCRKIYPVTSYAYTTIPTYPSGQIGFVLCSLSPDTKFENPVREFTSEEIKQLGLRYYNGNIHRAAFILPEFARQALQ